MSYTITISGQQTQGEGEAGAQAGGDVESKARQFVGSLPGVTAAFIQTEAGMTDLSPQRQPEAPTEPQQPTGEAPSV